MRAAALNETKPIDCEEKRDPRERSGQRRSEKSLTQMPD
jgi:hypothetical protein